MSKPEPKPTLSRSRTSMENLKAAGMGLKTAVSNFNVSTLFTKKPSLKSHSVILMMLFAILVGFCSWLYVEVGTLESEVQCITNEVEAVLDNPYAKDFQHDLLTGDTLKGIDYIQAHAPWLDVYSIIPGATIITWLMFVIIFSTCCGSQGNGFSCAKFFVATGSFWLLLGIAFYAIIAVSGFTIDTDPIKTYRDAFNEDCAYFEGMVRGKIDEAQGQIDYFQNMINGYQAQADEAEGLIQSLQTLINQLPIVPPEITAQLAAANAMLATAQAELDKEQGRLDVEKGNLAVANGGLSNIESTCDCLMDVYPALGRMAMPAVCALGMFILIFIWIQRMCCVMGCCREADDVVLDEFGEKTMYGAEHRRQQAADNAKAASAAVAKDNAIEGTPVAPVVAQQVVWRDPTLSSHNSGIEVDRVSKSDVPIGPDQV